LDPMLPEKQKALGSENRIQRNPVNSVKSFSEV